MGPGENSWADTSDLHADPKGSTYEAFTTLSGSITLKSKPDDR
jgi:hypothetical protein